MRKLSLRTCLSLAILAGFVVGWSQRIPSDEYFSLDQAAAFLLSDGEVAKELALSEAQEVVLAHCREVHEKRSNEIFNRPTPKADGIALVDQNFADASLKALHWRQRIRLRQIALQDLGPSALSRREVARAAGLTEVQRKRFDFVVQQFKRNSAGYSVALAKLIDEVPNGQTSTEIDDARQKKTLITQDFEASRIRRSDALQVQLKRLESKLTAIQRRRWATLKGPRFRRKSEG